MHPTSRARPFLFVCLMACLICIGAFGSAFGSQKAPAFTLPDLSGNKVTLEQYRGSVVILDFWAIWCVPCLKAIPQVVQLQEKYKGQGLVVLGISLDDPKTLDDLSLLEFKKRRKINYQILRGTEQVTEEYFRGIRLEIPALFIIDRDGMIVDRHKGFDLGDVEKALQKLL
jgi:peroxiredoxin